LVVLYDLPPGNGVDPIVHLPKYATTITTANMVHNNYISITDW